MSSEGSLEAPTRHPLPWKEESFYDFDQIHKEMERVFDICHGCRRCFNLCDSFPRLFDMIDESATGEVDSLKPEEHYKPVVDACTLCDMCFMTKCPYVPPHDFNLDFPHLMLRYRAAETRRDGPPKVERQLAQTDRNGRLAQPVAPIANLFSSSSNTVSRGLLESLAGIDREVELPKYHSQTFTVQARQDDRVRDASAPAAARKAVIYSTCIVEYNAPSTGMATKAVLEANGVQTEILYPACCGMPYFEHGDLKSVARQAAKVAKAFRPYVDKGYDVIAPTASCGLMLKFEWPLILPDNEDVKVLAAATRDVCQYVVDIAKKEGLKVKPQPVEGGVTAHLACHARAQNLGPKSAEMLKLIPDTRVDVIERCSGHGGTFGVMKATRPLARKVSRNAVNAAKKAANAHVCSDCPLACKHISQELDLAGAPAPRAEHPIEIFAAACGLT
ncbi:MAG: glycerol-3-phosphate dehydrogenase [Alphaproteobacteria bacterium]|nr:glycerol-3-phosphate dehydrogenase [Alphaproteobacteria bacterium]